MKYKIKHIAEYIFLKLTVSIFGFLPYKAALLNAYLLAWFFHHVLGWRKKLARSRIKEVFGDQFTDKEIKDIAWISIRNIAFNIAEMARPSRINAKWIDKHMDFGDSLEKFKKFAEEGPYIIAVVHMGNWDLAGIALQRLGFDCFFIMRAQKNPLTNKFINAQRTSLGSEVIERDDPSLIRKTVRKLKAGKAMAILLDLRAKAGYFHARWLNNDAHLASGVGIIAQLSKAKVIPVQIIRKGWAKHEIRILGATSADPDLTKSAAAEKITQDALDLISPIVLNNPEQYFWYNKRWVLDKRDD